MEAGTSKSRRQYLIITAILYIIIGANIRKFFNDMADLMTRCQAPEIFIIFN
ncbi:MAG: hypothetical protein HUJ74_00980 [Lachnospiraceae bacterium]|nr:hypothetical protein [Lachnospiraceae bacterium]